MIKEEESEKVVEYYVLLLVTGSRIFRPYLVVTCRDFPAVSAVTGSRIFRPYL
jgi:hypothetical protein